MASNRGMVTEEEGMLFLQSLGGGQSLRLMPLPPPPPP